MNTFMHTNWNPRTNKHIHFTPFRRIPNTQHCCYGNHIVFRIGFVALLRFERSFYFQIVVRVNQ
jgi:hypothetical protein